MSPEVPEAFSVFPFPFSKVREEAFSFMAVDAEAVLAAVLLLAAELLVLAGTLVETLPL